MRWRKDKLKDHLHVKIYEKQQKNEQKLFSTTPKLQTICALAMALLPFCAKPTIRHWEVGFQRFSDIKESCRWSRTLRQHKDIPTNQLHILNSQANNWNNRPSLEANTKIVTPWWLLFWQNLLATWKFNMAAIDWREGLHLAINSRRVVLFEWTWCWILHFWICRIQNWNHGLTL